MGPLLLHVAGEDAADHVGLGILLPFDRGEEVVDLCACRVRRKVAFERTDPGTLLAASAQAGANGHPESEPGAGKPVETARAVASEGPGGGRVPQRSAVVVLTDGIDTRSRLTSTQVATISSSIDIPVYIVAVMATIDDPREGGTALQEIAGPLPTLARCTGGELFMASAPAHASVAARQIVDELRHQYIIAFEASTREGWRALEVRARDRALTVRARAGYSSGNGGGVSGLSQ